MESEMQALEQLQKRVREATGPDRELDSAIGYILCDLAGLPMPSVGNPAAPYTTDPEGLGACVGLLREVLPGWTRVVDASAPELGIAVELLSPAEASLIDGGRSVKGDHDLETHATIDAIISAVIAQE